MKLSERALIHAENMQSEGWYTTANVLAACADSLAEAHAAVASIRTRVGQIDNARNNFSAASPLQIEKATEALLQTADVLERSLSHTPPGETALASVEG